MAKLEARVVVYGDSFARNTPRMSRLQAEEIVNKALGQPADTETPVELDGTDWQDEPTQPGVKAGLPIDVEAAKEAVGYGNWTHAYLFEADPLDSPKPKCTPKLTPSEILASAINRAEAMLPHGIEGGYERKAAWRSYMVTACCPHCGADEEVADFGESVVGELSPEQLAEVIDRNTRVRIPNCISATCCDPLDRYVDGLRVRECLWRWHENSRIGDMRGTAYHALTDLQLAAARSAWSAQLRAKQAQAREKERAAVVCERDEDGL